jgi:hydroxyacylglutathione hydrolase
MVMAGALLIQAVPVLNDNYVWLIHDPASGETAAVDPSVGPPVLDAAEARGWPITQVLNTHWHPDHTGGNQAIHAATGALVTGPEEVRRVYQPDRVVGKGDRVTLGSWEADVWAIPAHTAGHISYYFERASAVFVGDTLFAMGCGRLFEGTPEQMYRSLGRLADLPDATRLYPAHEYTLSNARFAVHAEPGNAGIAERLATVDALRAEGRITLPTTVAEERATNPFVRASSAAQFAERRAAKDSFG